MLNASSWKNLTNQVIQRKDQNDVFYNIPAADLIEKPSSRTIKGVVLATGDFENNQTSLEYNLGVTALAPLATLYL